MERGLEGLLIERPWRLRLSRKFEPDRPENYRLPSRHAMPHEPTQGSKAGGPRRWEFQVVTCLD